LKLFDNTLIHNQFFLISSASVLSLFLISILTISPQQVFADFNFGAAGDWGCPSNTDATLSNVKGRVLNVFLD
jgi:hypothetical protein